MATRFVPDRAGLHALANNPRIRALVTSKAEKAKQHAEGLAEEFRRTGEYVDSFRVVETTVTIRGLSRPAARLENTSDHAAAVEWGNAHDHRPHRVLGRTLDALGHL